MRLFESLPITTAYCSCPAIFECLDYPVIDPTIISGNEALVRAGVLSSNALAARGSDVLPLGC